MSRGPKGSTVERRGSPDDRVPEPVSGTVTEPRPDEDPGDLRYRERVLRVYFSPSRGSLTRPSFPFLNQSPRASPRRDHECPNRPVLPGRKTLHVRETYPRKHNDRIGESFPTNQGPRDHWVPEGADTRSPLKTPSRTSGHVRNDGSTDLSHPSG